jgi:hypothetical protein
MNRWLKEFDLDKFVIIDSDRLKSNPISALREIENFLEIQNHEYNLDESRHSNSAASRRPITFLGKSARVIFSIIPDIIKLPIVKMLQKRDFNIYNLPILSKRGISHKLEDTHYKICGEELIEELEILQKLTGFNVEIWCDEINRRI